MEMEERPSGGNLGWVGIAMSAFAFGIAFLIFITFYNSLVKKCKECTCIRGAGVTNRTSVENIREDLPPSYSSFRRGTESAESFPVATEEGSVNIPHWLPSNTPNSLEKLPTYMEIMEELRLTKHLSPTSDNPENVLETSGGVTSQNDSATSPHVITNNESVNESTEEISPPLYYE